MKLALQSKQYAAVPNRERLYRQIAQWRQARASFESQWREISEFTWPARVRFQQTEKNRGHKRHSKIINEIGTFAARTLQAGMFTGITSPARPWRKLSTPDPELNDYGPVKQALYVINERLAMFNRMSNFYNAAPTVFGDMGVFGVGCVGLFPDEQDLYRFYTFPVGSYWLGVNQRGQVDLFYREYQSTVRNLIEEFGTETASGAPDWTKFSPLIKSCYDRGDYEVEISVSQVIQPNQDYNPMRLDPLSKRYKDCYFETGATSMSGGLLVTDSVVNRSLHEGGYDLFPIMAPRWDVTGQDTYATSCPGMEALGSIKETQSLMKKKAKGLQKQLDPALTGPTHLQSQKTSLISGDITYVDVREGMQGLRPIHETKFSHADVRLDIQDLEKRISQTFYVPLFMMIDQMEGIQPRNEREIAERHEEKLLALGPVLERSNDEFLDPLTRLELFYLQSHGLMPPLPPELQRMPLKIEYVSMMAQAQKLVGIAGTERFLGFVGNLMEAWPEVKDKIDADQAVDDYADRMGVPAHLIKDDEAVEAIREARAQAQQQAAQAEMLTNTAQAAELLSKTDTSTDNALTRVMAGA